MQRKTKKNNLSNLIIVLFICSAVIFAALHISIGEKPIEDLSSDNTESQNVDEPIIEEPVVPSVDENYEGVGFNLGEFLYKDIYINGYHSNNWQIYKPFISVEGTIYVPMTDIVQKALGISIEFDDSMHVVKILQGEAVEDGTLYEDSLGCNLQFQEVYWGHQYFINNELAPIYYAVTSKPDDEGNRQLYLSLDALQRYGPNSFSYYYDDVSGLYISTVSNIDAQSFYSDNNHQYIEGRARFMMSVNSDLDYETALYYEYLFRHEASLNQYEDQDLLMGVCKTESMYRHVAKSEVEAIGLMQVMLYIAEGYGYTFEMIRQPHYNVQFGANWLELFIEMCEGDLEMGISSYYWGYGGVCSQINSTGSYDKNYVNVVLNNKNMIQSWVADNGYSNSFSEYTGE